MNGSFFEQGCDLISVLNQVDANTDVDGDWIKVIGYERVLFLISKLGSEDVDTLGIGFIQAKDSSGTDAKALNVSRYSIKQGTLTSQGVWTQGTLATPDDIVGVGSAAPAGGTLVTAVDVNTDQFMLGVDVLASDLDTANGFKWATVRIEGDELNNACLISVFAILSGAKFASSVPLSAIS